MMRTPPNRIAAERVDRKLIGGAGRVEGEANAELGIARPSWCRPRIT